MQHIPCTRGSCLSFPLLPSLSAAQLLFSMQPLAATSSSLAGICFPTPFLREDASPWRQLFVPSLIQQQPLLMLALQVSGEASPCKHTSLAMLQSCPFPAAHGGSLDSMAPGRQFAKSSPGLPHCNSFPCNCSGQRVLASSLNQLRLLLL